MQSMPSSRKQPGQNIQVASVLSSVVSPTTLELLALFVDSWDASWGSASKRTQLGDAEHHKSVISWRVADATGRALYCLDVWAGLIAKQRR